MPSKRKTVLESLPGKLPSIINGEPAESAGADELPVINPDDGSTLIGLLEASAADVDRAVASARQSFHSGAWSRASVSRRQQVLFNTAELIKHNAEELAILDSLSTGLLYHESTARQVSAAAGWFEYFAGLLGSAGEAMYRQLPQITTTVTREPAGVAALFTPWNIPLMGAALKLAAALCMGNSCVLKPSEHSPLGAARLVELLHEAGLPNGVLHLVNGRGPVTGSALAANADVDLLSFTGGEHAGRRIAAQAAQRFAKVTMELGGKSANIIFDDADYERALDGALTAIYSNNGEACLAGSRILVQRRIAERFIADFVSRAESIRVGRPFDANAELGPQITRQHMERVLSYAEIATQHGGELLTGGARAAGFEDGFYINPLASLATSNAAPICQEEIFGPFATFLIFDTEDDAVAMANGTRFGLAGYVWSENLQRALRVSERIRSGYVLINTSMIRDRNAPFGGYGHSGLGREGGRWSLDFYSEAKSTVIPHAHPSN